MVLLVASYIFYMSWSIPCGFLILLPLYGLLCRIGLGKIEGQHRRKLLLIVSILANLGVLVISNTPTSFSIMCGGVPTRLAIIQVVGTTISSSRLASLSSLSKA